MAQYITAILMGPPGTEPKHIEQVWVGLGPSYSDSDTMQAVAQIVGRLRASEQFLVRNPKTGNESRVIPVDATPPHIRTTPDGTPDDNLLALPRRVWSK